MQIRGVVLVSVALFLGIGALILHLLAICSPDWKITQRDREPKMGSVSYGLWQRCEYANLTIMKQGVALGIRPNVQLCRPNRYMRYSPEKYDTCYHIRRNCPVAETTHIPEGCSCRYLPSTKALQWLTILAAIFLVFALLLLYMKTIVSAENEIAMLVLSYGPVLGFFLTLLLMIVTLILVGAYLRRDVYEDYTFPLTSISTNTNSLQGFDLHSLRNYAKHHKATFSHEQYLAAEKELRAAANNHYQTTIGRATIYEIIATVLTLIATALAFLLATASRQGNL